jgi:hypothetical protein
VQLATADYSPNAATSTSNGQCIADADPTTTGVLDPDTDRGGVKDGDEDTNKNGKVDPGERDPNNKADDSAKTCKSDSECGGPNTVCVDQFCGPGCRGKDGNGCPSGLTCTSTTDAVGTCEPASSTTNDGGLNGVTDDGMLAGGGCACSLAALATSEGWPARGGVASAPPTPSSWCGAVAGRRTKSPNKSDWIDSS